MSETCGVRACPFCDSLELRMVLRNGRAVECTSCGAFGPIMGNAENAWAAWNRGVLFEHPPADSVAERLGGIIKSPRPLPSGR